MTPRKAAKGNLLTRTTVIGPDTTLHHFTPQGCHVTCS